MSREWLRQPMQTPAEGAASSKLLWEGLGGLWVKALATKGCACPIALSRLKVGRQE